MVRKLISPAFSHWRRRPGQLIRYGAVPLSLDLTPIAHARHASLTELAFDSLKNQLAQLVHLEQVAEGEDRDLLEDPIADQLDVRKAAHGRNLDQGLFHGRIAEGMPLLQQVDP